MKRRSIICGLAGLPAPLAPRPAVAAPKPEAPPAPASLDELTEWCEEGFTRIRDTDLPAVPVSVPEPVPQWPDPGSRVTLTRTHYVVNFTNGYMAPNGQTPHVVETRAEALRLFWEGWQRYRAETPGETLVWRKRPRFWKFEDPTGRNPTRWSVIARFVIIDTRALAEEARRAAA